jgi:regulator of protease activity HflC (stomatin/prohibitin superfamily)
MQNESGMIVDAEHGRVAPPGSVSEAMHPAMAAAVDEELKRRARSDAELARREADREEYLHQLRSRA